MDDKDRSGLQEDLVALYLRLNGFFVSQFIVHSPVHGRNLTQIDALAVRLPFSSEFEREIGTHSLLGLTSKYTDLVLCEVKSNGQQLRFNDALTENPSTVGTVLRWSGLFKDSEIKTLSSQVTKQLRLKNPSHENPPTVPGPRGTRIRALLFSPERINRQPKNEPWYIEGSEVMDYVWQCLCPKIPRQSCATTYDLQVWGRYESIVRYFKEARCAEQDSGSMKDLYAFFEGNQDSERIQPIGSTDFPMKSIK
jgi:hypothetical protein